MHIITMPKVPCCTWSVQAKVQSAATLMLDAVGSIPERNISATLFWLAATHVHLARNPDTF